MSKKPHSPFRFVPHHQPPEEPGEEPLLFAFRGREMLVTHDHTLPDVSTIDEHGFEAVRRQYLGALDGRHCYSVELPHDCSEVGALKFTNLHMLFGTLDEETHAIAGRAVQIVEWDRTHQYCGGCAEPTVLSEADRSRICPSCKIPMYPRLAPAMIVAVEKGDEILLARSPHFPEGIMSVLAGFVEPGESAEAAVEREVFEETAIHVKNVQYFSSQAWPFPNSLMLGFRAEYAGGEIHVDGEEIVAADWFKASDMPHFFPGRVSISQWLIHDFLERNGVPRHSMSDVTTPPDARRGQTRPSICRFCHANCGILVEVEDGRPVRVTGDRENPAYFGFTCAKGRSLPEQHAHPDRLLHSQKRLPDGRYESIASETALDEIAERIRRIVAEHGPRSVALYPGTYSGPHPASIPTGVGFMLGLGSRMVFTSAAIDQPGKHVANAIHGRWLGGSHVFDESDVWMLVGNNPLISMSGGIPPSNPGRRLREAKKRGLSLIVIDPRRTEVARFADVYLQPRAGEDPTILAAMLHVILREERYDRAFCEAHVSGFTELAEQVADFTPEYAEERAGVSASDIELAARTFAGNPKSEAPLRGCGVAGTGPNMSPRGNLTEYLLLGLNTVCGRWRREGEVVPNPGALLPRAIAKAQAAPPRAGWGRGESLKSRALGNSAAGLPTGALADEILYEGEGQIRALICVGSNPVAAWPDQIKTIRAMEKLDLLITLDMKMSATSKFADYVVAPKLSLEVPGLSLSSESIEQTYVAHGYPEPYAQYTEAIVDPPPGSDVIEEWEFFYGLSRRLGFTLSCYPIRPETGALRERRESFDFDMAAKPTTDWVLESLVNGARVPLSKVREFPHGGLFEDEEIRVAAGDSDCLDRLDVGNPTMLGELAEIRGEALPDPEDANLFQLISRRLPNVYNSSGRDIAKLNGRKPYNPAFLHPDDLARLGLEAGDLVEISTPHSSILGVAEAAPEVRPGVISMAHCFGDIPADGDSEARSDERGGEQGVRQIGSNTSRLIDNEADFDPYTGIPRMSAIPVSIARA